MGDKRSPESHSGAGGWTLRIHDVPANYISTLSLKPASYSGEQKPPDTEESVKKGELEWTWQWSSELVIVKITFAFIIYKNLWLSDDTTRALEDPWVQAPWGSLPVNPWLTSLQSLCPTASRVSSDPAREAISKPVAEQLSWNFLLILRNSWSFLFLLGWVFLPGPDLLSLFFFFTCFTEPSSPVASWKSVFGSWFLW